MLTKVHHSPSGKTFILLGTGFGAFRAIRPSLIMGNLIPHEEKGVYELAAICDHLGRIRFADVNDLRVEEVNGVKINEIQGLGDFDLIEKE